MFVLYAAGLIALVESYGLSPHLYADDTQIYGSCSPSHVDMFLSVDTDCVNAVVDWMKSNRLQLNSVKTEFMWCATVCRHHCLPTVGPLIGSSTVTPSSAVGDLGVYIDPGLTMQSHVRQTVSRCFAVFRQLRTVAYVVKYQLQCSSRLLLHSFFPDWITATVSCLDFLLTSSSVSNLSRTQRLG